MPTKRAAPPSSSSAVMTVQAGARPSWRPRILVVGDAMLDCYWDGVVERISPEAPVPVLQIRQQSDRAGGAANVAANLSALGAHVSLLTLLGCDMAADRLTHAVDAQGVELHALCDPAYRTTQKIRCVSQRQQMLRADVEDIPPEALLPRLRQRYEALLAEHDLVVLSDYGKGALAEAARLIQLARRQAIPVLVDPKGTDYRRYRGATLVKPNLSEFKAVAGAFQGEEDFTRRADRLRRLHDFTHLLVTMGDAGMRLFSDAGQHQVAAHRREVYDVSGAGDTVLATLAIMLSSGRTLADSVRWANLAGSLVVGKFGTSVLTLQELLDAATQTPSFMDEDDAAGDLAAAAAALRDSPAWPAGTAAPAATRLSAAR